MASNSSFLFHALLLSCSFVFANCAHQTQEDDSARLAHLQTLRDRLQEELGDSYNTPVPQATARQLKRGAELYPQTCASCHGARGDGIGHNGGAILGTPSNLTDPEEARFFSEQARIYIIKKGVPGTAMLGWEKVLPEEDIISLYVYIRSMIIEK